jgi:hypothetical protein
MWLHDVLKIGKKNELVDKRQKKRFGVNGKKRGAGATIFKKGPAGTVHRLVNRYFYCQVLTLTHIKRKEQPYDFTYAIQIILANQHPHWLKCLNCLDWTFLVIKGHFIDEISK